MLCNLTALHHLDLKIIQKYTSKTFFFFFLKTDDIRFMIVIFVVELLQRLLSLILPHYM